MKIPDNLKLNKRKLSDKEILKGKRMIKEGNSERFVARMFGVSRHNIRMHCINGFAKKYREKYPVVRESDERRNKRTLERYYILCKEFPEEMKKSRKKQKERIGKEYFRLKSAEYRKRQKELANKS